MRLLERARQARILGPDIFLLAISLAFGLAFVFAIPLGGGWDEETHLIRAWEIASLHFIPNQLPRNKLPFPAIYRDLSYRRQFLLRPIEPGFWEQYGGLPLDAHRYIYDEYPTRSVYSPPLLFPHALAIRYLGHAYDLPALTVFYASRILGLVSYTTLAWLAVRIAPYGKWTLALLAITPTALYQAATISTDPLSNGLGLFYVAGCLALTRREGMGWREWAGLTALTALLFLAKPNLAALALLPFLILSPSRFRRRAGYALLVATALVLAIVEVGGWAAIAYPYLPYAPPGTDPAGQLSYLLGHPGSAAATIMSDLLQHGSAYFRQWIAEYGYGYWSVPLPSYLLFLPALAAAVFADSRSATLSGRTRAALVMVFMAGYLTSVLSLYLAFTPVGSSRIEGVQGRYFSAFVPLLAMALIGLRSSRLIRRPARWMVILASGSTATFSLGLMLSYHVQCGTAVYQPGLCYQPVYKNWAPNARYSPPISGTTALAQEIVLECDGAEEIRVWVDAGRAPEDGSTDFILRDDDSKRELVRSSEQNADLPNGGWYSLHFPTEWDSAGRRYSLVVQPSSASISAGPRIAYTILHEYRAGWLYENQERMNTDLVFQYGCVAGLEQLLRIVGNWR